MAQNNPTSDSNPNRTPNLGTIEFDSMLFEDIEKGDLFWTSDQRAGQSNPAYRKLDDYTALNTRTRQTSNFNRRIQIFQKT